MNKMQYRKLPHGEEQISILGLGTSSIQAADTLAYDHYRKLEKKASDCMECGHCNSRCPFHVDQMARMKAIAEYFGG